MFHYISVARRQSGLKAGGRGSGFENFWPFSVIKKNSILHKNFRMTFLAIYTQNSIYPATFIHKSVYFRIVRTLDSVSLSYFSMYIIPYNNILWIPHDLPMIPHQKIWGSWHPNPQGLMPVLPITKHCATDYFTLHYTLLYAALQITLCCVTHYFMLHNTLLYVVLDIT